MHSVSYVEDDLNGVVLQSAHDHRTTARARSVEWCFRRPAAALAAVVAILVFATTAGPTLVSAAEPPSATMLLELSTPMRGQWRVLDEGLASRDVRLELRLGPKGIPKSRFVGSTLLRAERDTTWIEFTGSRLDQVLKLRVDCRADRELEVVITPYVQTNAGAGMVRYSEALERRLKVQSEFVARRSEYQMRMLGAAPGGKDGQTIFLSSNQLTPSGERTRMMADYHYRAAREAQQRLEHLDLLREKLDGAARLEIRASRADDSRLVGLQAAETAGQ